MLRPKRQKLVELDVERINVVDSEGNLRMALFNAEDMPDVFVDGESYPGVRASSCPASGIMFYNGEGDECGGLIFGSRKEEDGQYEHFVSLSFDAYKQDQLLQLRATDRNGSRNYALSMWERPKRPISEAIQELMTIDGTMEDGPEKQAAMRGLFPQVSRMFIGRNDSGSVMVSMADGAGRDRLRMAVDKEGNPRIEFLDEKGKVTYTIPPTEPDI